MDSLLQPLRLKKRAMDFCSKGNEKKERIFEGLQAAPLRKTGF
jgi:hypothetical protein